MAEIHPSSIIDSAAKVAKDVTIGPFCTVGPHVEIGPGCRLISHVVVDGHTHIGAGNTLYPFAVIGLPPQDKKFRGEETKLTIGNNNIFREYVTVHPGTADGGGLTTIGNDNLLMIQAHVAHDCHLGNGTILANSATLGGHVEVGDFAILGGLSAVHQFVRVGRCAFIGGVTAVTRDVPPFAIVSGQRARLEGLNLVGLRRRGASREAIRALQEAFEATFNGKTGTVQERAKQLGDVTTTEEVRNFLEFIGTTSSRGLCLPEAEEVADAP